MNILTTLVDAISLTAADVAYGFRQFFHDFMLFMSYYFIPIVKTIMFVLWVCINMITITILNYKYALPTQYFIAVVLVDILIHILGYLFIKNLIKVVRDGKK